MQTTTQIFVLLVSVVYIFVILRRATRTKIDLMDMIFLLTLVIIPGFFTVFETSLTEWTHALGIHYPFILMFALIHACSFIYFSMLAARLNRLRQREIHLIQELSLLREQVTRWRNDLTPRPSPNND